MGTHPIFESDFDCLTESDCSKMFRLSKGNQSRKNHKIINQTTKVSDADAKLSTPAMQAQQHQEALMKQQAEEEAAMLESQKKSWLSKLLSIQLNLNQKIKTTKRIKLQFK